MLWKIFKIVLISLVVIMVGGFVFVKLDTPLAAQWTDAYLRPIFGDKFVVFMEGIFFNVSDVSSRVIYAFKTPVIPKFIEQSHQTGLASSLDLSPLATISSFSPLPGEGMWNDIPLKVSPDREIMAYTFIRPDPARSFAIVSIVQMDTTALAVGDVAGTKEPGGPAGNPGPGIIPKAVVSSGNLVAAFNGGFQYRDGAYGMLVGNRTYLPLKDHLGTFARFTDGSIKIFDYNGQDMSQALFVRQNCPLLVDNDVIVAANPASRSEWGRVVGGSMYTWRSGIGITSSGNLLFAAGNNLNPITLAQALKKAGAVNAMQLDINPFWVRFNIFDRSTSGSYDTYPLTSDLTDGSSHFLNGYNKDFFYVYKK